MGIHHSPTKNITLSQSVWVSMCFSFSWNARNIRKKWWNLYSVGQHFSCIHLKFSLSLQSEYINKDKGKKVTFLHYLNKNLKLFSQIPCLMMHHYPQSDIRYIWVHIWVPRVALQFERWLQTAMDVSTFTVLCFCTTTASLHHAYVVGTWGPPLPRPPTQSIFIW